MPLRRRNSLKIDDFNISVSYKINEKRIRLIDSLNVFSNQGRLESRHGLSRFNDTATGTSPKSISFYRDASGTNRILVKDGTSLYVVASSGAHTAIKTGLTSTTKHRGITMNYGTKSRHIISIESDGLFSYDGSTFTQLGQAVPSAPTVAASGSGNTLDADDYQVAITFYSSTLGFETNIGTASSTVTVGAGQQIDVSDMDSTAANGFIDKIRVYLKNITDDSDWLFWDELSLGTTTDTIDDNPSSTQTPPTTHGAVTAGGGMYLTLFNRKLVYAGNSTNKNDVFFSEQDLPDAFDDDGTTQLRLYAPGQGDITGLATGFFNDSVLDPYLVVFKRNSTHIYSEVSGYGRFVPVSSEVGCVSHDTIREVNGDIYFLSESGWRLISNARLIKDKNRPLSLSEDIDDIFKDTGFALEINKSNFSNFFSVYYSTLDHYLTFVSEGSNSAINKAYNFEFMTRGFKPYVFELNLVGGVTGKDSSNDEVVYFLDDDGFIYTHSIKEDRTDVDKDAASVTNPVYAQLLWVPTKGDLDASFNFREFIVRALASSNDITVKAWIDFDISDFTDHTYSFDNITSGFVLDVSKLDEGVFGLERNIIKARADINRCGRTLLLGFYQTASNGNIGLSECQLDFSKNGNPN